jgi:hypothetical protein
MLREAGVAIQGALDKGQGGRDWAATDWMYNEKIKVYRSDSNKLPDLGKLRPKLMVIDDAGVNLFRQLNFQNI